MEFSSALGGKGNSINFEENTDLKCAVPKSHAYPATTDVYCEAKMPHAQSTPILEESPEDPAKAATWSSESPGE